jgi:hypothetical protein
MVVATDHQRNCRICQVLAGKLPAQPGTVNLYSIDFLCTGEYNAERVALSAWATGGRGTTIENIAIPLIDFGGKQDSNCKLLKNKLSAAWHQQESSNVF